MLHSLNITNGMRVLEELWGDGGRGGRVAGDWDGRDDASEGGNWKGANTAKRRVGVQGGGGGGDGGDGCGGGADWMGYMKRQGVQWLFI